LLGFAVQVGGTAGVSAAWAMDNSL
jgi:hypothetical protein